MKTKTKIPRNQEALATASQFADHRRITEKSDFEEYNLVSHWTNQILAEEPRIDVMTRSMCRDVVEKALQEIRRLIDIARRDED